MWQKISQIAPLLVITLALVLEGGWNIWNYFGVWAPQNRYADPDTQLAWLIGDYLGQQPAGHRAYVADTPGFRAEGWSSLDFLRKSTPFEDIDQAMAEALPNTKLAPRTIFIFPLQCQSELAAVQQTYPGGQVVKRYLGFNCILRSIKSRASL